MGGHKRLLGGDRCTWGPSFWCHQIKNAKQCSAVNHCVQSVWTKQQEPVDDTPMCRWCDDLMDDIRELVAANTSKNAMRGYLKDGCKRVPVASQRNTCLEDISSDLVEIKQLLAAKVADRTICKTINFCSSAAKSENDALIVAKPRPGVNGRDYCEDCHNFFEDAKEMYIGNYTEDEFKQMLLQQCDQAGYPAITELCKTVIDQYWPQIYARLQMFFDPDEVCYQLNFCNSSLKMNPKWTLPLVPLTVARLKNSAKNSVQQLPVDRMLLNFNLNSARTPAVSSKKTKGYKSDVECVVCEFVMSYLDKMLEDNYTEAAIQSALDRVCTTMPKSVRSDCQSFVDQYAPAILVLLGNELDPAVVCQGLNLCTSTNKNAVCGAANCDSCDAVFQAIKTMMEDYDENVRFSNMIKEYCAFFPGDAKNQCETAVVNYVPYALQMLAQLLSPKVVCEAVKLCNAV